MPSIYSNKNMLHFPSDHVNFLLPVSYLILEKRYVKVYQIWNTICTVLVLIFASSVQKFNTKTEECFEFAAIFTHFE